MQFDKIEVSIVYWWNYNIKKVMGSAQQCFEKTWQAGGAVGKDWKPLG